MRNFVIAYAVLVALPVAGLLGVLRHGRALTAPISVDGVWRLQADAAQLAKLPCGKSLASAENPAFTISQSGTNFALEFARGLKSVTSGTISGTALQATLSPSGVGSGDAQCSADRRFFLAATVDPDAKPRSLVGTLALSDCPSCMPVELRATREPQPKAKRGH
jgi:hypothetical protein